MQATSIFLVAHEKNPKETDVIDFYKRKEFSRAKKAGQQKI